MQNLEQSIQSLYEESNDFPFCQEPRLKYVLAAIPRTGSTLLALLLWRTGCLGAPMEYLAIPFRDAMIARLGNGDVIAYWNALIRSRTSPNGVFGYKSFIQSMQYIAKHHQQLLPFISADRAVYLTRRNKIEQAVSLSKAIQSRSWFSSVVESRVAEYKFNHIRFCENSINQQERSWEDAFALTQTKPLRIFYEDLQSTPSALVQSVADYLGISLDPSAAIGVPLIGKQFDRRNDEWVQRYSEQKNQSKDVEDLPNSELMSSSVAESK